MLQNFRPIMKVGCSGRIYVQVGVSYILSIKTWTSLQKKPTSRSLTFWNNNVREPIWYNHHGDSLGCVGFLTDLSSSLLWAYPSGCMRPSPVPIVRPNGKDSHEVSRFGSSLRLLDKNLILHIFLKILYKVLTKEFRLNCFDFNLHHLLSMILHPWWQTSSSSSLSSPNPPKSKVHTAMSPSRGYWNTDCR